MRAGSNAKLSLVRACELEPARHFLNVALSNSKELESKSKSPPGRTCGEGLRYCWTQDKPVRRPREFSLRETNEHENNSPRKAHRPARGERLRFLEPERRRTGPTGVDRRRQCEHCSKQPSSRLRSRICTSLRTPWQRVGRRRGSRPTLKVSSSWPRAPCQPRKTSHPCCNICYALLIVGIAWVVTSA